jgi:hypothetical protein
MSTFTLNTPASTPAFAMPFVGCAAVRYAHVWSDVAIEAKRQTTEGSRSWRSPDC